MRVRLPSDGDSQSPRDPDREARELSTRIAHGDPDALASFYEAWFDRLYGLARKLTRRDESFCLDVVQDAMLRVVRSIEELPSRAALEAWLGRVVQTAALDRMRRELRRARREAEGGLLRWTVRSRIETADALELEERIAWLRGELARLDRRDRAILGARYGGDITFDELGRTLGSTGHAVSSRLRRILVRLRALGREAFHESF